MSSAAWSDMGDVDLALQRVDQVAGLAGLLQDVDAGPHSWYQGSLGAMTRPAGLALLRSRSRRAPGWPASLIA